MSHTPGLAAGVLVGGDDVEVQLAPAQLYLAGPFAGNVVLVVRTAPILPPKSVVDSIRIQVGSDPEKLPPMAYEPFADGSIEITFHSPTAIAQLPLPDRLEIWWSGRETVDLGRLALSPARDSD